MAIFIDFDVVQFVFAINLFYSNEEMLSAKLRFKILKLMYHLIKKKLSKEKLWYKRYLTGGETTN